MGASGRLLDETERSRYERDLHVAERAAAAADRRVRTLERVVAELCGATSVAGVADVVVQRGREALEARGAALLLVERDDDGATVRPACSAGFSLYLMSELQEAAEPVLADQLARGVRSVPLDERLWALQPGVASAMAEARFVELLVAPATSGGLPLGALVLGRAAPSHPGRDGGLIQDLDEPPVGGLPAGETALLGTLARIAGQAVQRVRLLEQAGG